MRIPLSGSTAVYYIVGDPIAQVKSPQGVTESLQHHGHNAVCVPAHVKSEDLALFMQSSKAVRNLNGVIVTVPHKIPVATLCDRISERAQFLGAVNVIRRTELGWFGDMCDGEGYLNALGQKGVDVKGKKLLLIGVGGAGSAIALAMVQAGVEVLAIHDVNTERRDHLIQRLRDLGLGQVVVGTNDPRGFDVVINATPIGMRETDPLPLNVEGLQSTMVVGDVITSPEVTPLLEAAQGLGCVTVQGLDMFAQVRDLMVDFLLQECER